MNALIVSLLLAQGIQVGPAPAINPGPVPAISSGPVAIGPSMLTPAGAVSHVYWNGYRLVDKLGLAWAQTGAVPQLKKSGRTPAGSGSYTASDYYSLAGSALGFAGDFTACFVFIPTSSTTAAYFSKANGTVSGWQAYTASNFIFIQVENGGAVQIGTPNSPVLNVPNVACVGRAGATIYTKLNLGAAGSTAGGAIVADTTTPSRIGLLAAGTFPFQGRMLEQLFVPTAFSEANATAQMLRVKTRLGVAAW